MDLQILNVLDHGDLDKERVRFKAVKDNVYLNEFIVMDNTYDDEGRLSNKNRHCYDFINDNVKLKKNDRVVLHTKEGKNFTKTFPSGVIAYHIYWGLDETVWNQDGDTVHLTEIAERVTKEV